MNVPQRIENELAELAAMNEPDPEPGGYCGHHDAHGAHERDARDADRNGHQQRSKATPSGLIRASGLWEKQGKRGRFFSGQVSQPIPAGSKVLIFKNDLKKSANEPDFTLCFIGPETQPPMPERRDVPTSVDDSDIPF